MMLPLRLCRPSIKRFVMLAAASSAVLTCIPRLARSQAVQPSAPASRPMLDALSRETAQLYAEVSVCVVRIQLPLPRWVFEGNQPLPDQLAKWGRQIDPGFLRQLQAQAWLRQQMQGPSAPQSQSPGPSTMPGSSGPQTFPPGITTASSSTPQPRGTLIIPLDPGPMLGFDPRNSGSLSPNALALVLDEQGNLLVPTYIEKEAIGEIPVPVLLASGRVVPATFVGSDRLTNLTVLHMPDFHDRPAVISPNRPADGSLVMLMPLNPDATRLVVWTGGGADYAVAATPDGSIAGFTQHNHFMCVGPFAGIARQLIDYGSIRQRSILGVVPAGIDDDDPIRLQPGGLGSRPALRVMQVVLHSAADQAGIRPGDLILSIGGQEMPLPACLAAAVALQRGPTEMQILRGTTVMRVMPDLEPVKN
jgi:hypothetical protein